MMLDPLALPVVFFAGVLSFLAPCVIPLLPAYVSVITGLSLKQLKTPSPQMFMQILGHSLSYIAGFSTVFILLGLGASSLGRFFIINRVVFSQIGGVLIIIFGLYLLGVFRRFSWSEKEWKFAYRGSPFLMGIAFGFAWTPCVGPILGAVLTLAATSASLTAGATLLLVYALGISLPFLIVAFTLGSLNKLLFSLSRFTSLLLTLSGVVLVILGVLLVTGHFTQITSSLLSSLYSLPFYQSLMGSL